MSIKSQIAGVLPKKVKSSIRMFLQFFHLKPERIIVDKPSVLSIGSFDGFEVAYRKNTADESVIKHSFSNDIFFASVPEYHPKNGHVIIEIGAHIGTFSLLVSSKVGSGKVYAIEASEDTYNYLKINAALNHCGNLSVHHLALTDCEGQCNLYHDDGNWGHSIVKNFSGTSEVVQSCTLAAFLERNHIAECQFMKLNCEGAEFPILLSTPRDMLRRIETILVLYHCDLWGKNTGADLISHIESCGFTCVVRNQTETRGWIIAKRIG